MSTPPALSKALAAAISVIKGLALKLSVWPVSNS